MVPAIILAVLIVGGLMVFGYLVSIYNRLVALKNTVKQAWSNIDVLLKQRYDEIPKLVSICERYMVHERETLQAVIAARQQYASARGDVGQIAGAEGQMQQALVRLFGVAEAYPELKADRSFSQLQSRVSQLEDNIADRREFYNHAVTSYNSRLEQFPDMFVAKMGTFPPSTLWMIPDERHREDPGITWKDSRSIES